MNKDKLNILLLPAHEPIDIELMRSWVEMGHTVFLYPHKISWKDDVDKIPSQVIRGLCDKPDVIYCGIKEDADYALISKIKNLWFGTPIVMIHWWFPSINPTYYFIRNVSVCEYGRDYLKKLLYISSPVIYCPIDTEFFKPNKEEEKMSLIIGHNFRGRDIMGYPYLIDILKKVHLMDPKIKLVLLGKNNPSDFPDYVECAFASKAKMLLYLNRASSVFFTTTRNLIMHSMEIAMSCGKNVIAFDLPSFHEVIKNNESGFLIPEFDTDSFAKKIVEVTNNPSSEMGKKAREIIIEKCERRKVARQLVELI